MPTPPRHNDGGDFARLSEGTPYHVVIASAKNETEEIPAQFRKDDGPTEREVTKLVFVVAPGQENDEGEDVDGAKVWLKSGFSLHPKSWLRKVAVAVFPRDPKDDDELYAKFDTDKLPGKQCILVGEYPIQSDGKTRSDYLKPTMFKRLPKAKFISDEDVAELLKQANKPKDENKTASKPAAKSGASKAKAKPEPAENEDEGDLEDF